MIQSLPLKEACLVLLLDPTLPERLLALAGRASLPAAEVSSGCRVTEVICTLSSPASVLLVVSAAPSIAIPAMYEAAWSVRMFPSVLPFQASLDLLISEAKPITKCEPAESQAP